MSNLNISDGQYERFERDKDSLRAELSTFLHFVRREALSHNPRDIEDDNGCPCIDVRLWLRPDGTVEHAEGDAQYDTDLRGACGSGDVGPDDSDAVLKQLAHDMVSAALDDAWAQGGYEQ